MRKYDTLRDQAVMMLLTVIFSLLSTGFTTWLTVRDLKREVAAHTQTLSIEEEERVKLQKENNQLAIAIARLNALVEQLNRQLERLER